MRQADYKAVKGLPLNPNAYSWVTIGGRNVKITEANKDEAIDWFAEWAAEQVNALGNGRKVLVPVPSSKTTRQSPGTFRTALLAERIAERCPSAVAAPILRFVEAMPNSREEGGSRVASVLYPKLVLAGALPVGQCVLVDDVPTGGGHLIASAWTVEDEGRTVEHAVCCGRSLEEQIDDPFAVAPETLVTQR